MTRNLRRPLGRPALFTLLPLMLAGSATTVQGAAGPANAPSAAQPPLDEGRDWSATLGLDLGSLTSTRSFLTLGLAGAAAAWCWEETDENQSGIRRTLDASPIDFLMDFGTVYGNGLVVGGAAVTAGVAGALTGDRELAAFGQDLGLAFAYSSVAAIGLKIAFDRKRPSGGPWSFPSGHTTSAFCTVPVVWRHAGPLAGAGAAGLAILTGLGRMEENRHYASDVVFGAALGWVFGRAVVDRRDPTGLTSHLAVAPGSTALVWAF